MRRLALLLPLLLASCAAHQLGANAALTNYVGPNLAVTDLLFQKTDFTITDLNSTLYIQPGGAVASPTTGDALFDFRPYRSVHVLFYVGTLSGGTTPKAGIICYGYDQATYPGAGYWVSSAAPATITGSGTKILLGEVGTSATGTGNEGVAATVGYLPMYAHCQLVVSGSPTGIGAPGLRVSIFGRR